MKKINIFKNIIIFVVIFCSLCYTVDAILDQNLYRILIRLSVIPVIFLPKIINVTFKTKISDASEIIYIIFVFIAHFLGSVINLYGKIYWYDNFTHYLSGIVVAFFALELLYKLDRYDSKKIFFTCLFIIAFNTMCASFWEFFEFISDNIFGKDAQNVLMTGVNDTMMDMILASLGSLTFVITYIFEEFNNKKLIVKNFVEQL